jgi:hypothetical protein
MTQAADYFEMAREGTLPEDFNRGEIRDCDGRTVAHEAAKRGTLPAGFDRWELANNHGMTVADVKAAQDRWMSR